ncbi:MAG TPA: hypothetical protein VLH56_17000 [Dissulfurispiraceae bacterium]|nr:hypothetical protein [Dissulfurispiraceae bacterium]
MKRITVKTGQTAFDIALQEYGHPEGVLWLSDDNNLDGLQLASGQELIIRAELIDRDVVNFFKNKGINPVNH